MLYREKEMTLPKGYKPPSSNNNNNNNYRPTRPKKNLKKGIVFFVLFLISLYFLVTSVMNYIESGKELDEQKKRVEQAKIDVEKAEKEFKDRFGYLPPNPYNTP